MALAVGSPREIASRWLGWYLAVSAGLFLAGVGLGWVLIGGVTPEALAGFSGSTPSLFPSRITLWSLLSNNLVALAVVISGVVTFAVTTVGSLFFNGLVFGFILGAAESRSLLVVAALILPHGIFELPAFWIAGAVAIRVTHRLTRYLRGLEETILTESERNEAVVLAILATGLIVIAAMIEVRYTLAIAEGLTGRSLAGG